MKIEIKPDEDPAISWIRAMHEENNIPYIPGLIDIRILNEIEHNPDVQAFVDFIGVEIEEENNKKQKEENNGKEI